MNGYQIKGIPVVKVNYRHNCQYPGCKRAAYYKFNASTAVGKAFRKAVTEKREDKYLTKQNGRPTYYNHVPYGTGYYCSFDCARKDLLVKTFEAKVRLTPLVKDFLGQGELPITDHETIIEDNEDIYLPNNSNPGLNEDFIKISPNGIPLYPIQIDFSHHGRNTPIGLTTTGAMKLIKALQTIVTEGDIIFAEKARMSRRKRK